MLKGSAQRVNSGGTQGLLGSEGKNKTDGAGASATAVVVKWPKVKFSTFEGCPKVVTSTFERAGWVQTQDDKDWNVGWFGVSQVRSMFHPDSGVRLGDLQMVNHYPNHLELCHKALMAKNIKRFMRDTRDAAEENGPTRSILAATGLGEFTYKDGYIPMTYNLPADYNIFLEEYKRNPSSWWIMKPQNGLQGKGIFLVNKLSQLKKWSTKAPGLPAYIISRYISNPLLIGGKKFDLRLYVLVTSYRPLRVYQYLHGFARFCNVKYSAELSDLDNPYMHLTNVAIQKSNSDYNSAHGGKWHIRDLRLWIESTQGAEASDTLFSNMNRLIVHSLLACQDVIVNDRHCFECYGYDLLIDDDLKPWLVEVNASPSLSPSTHSDKVMKQNLIRDVYRIVVPPDAQGWAEWRGANNTGPMKDVGSFVVLFDQAAQEASAAKENHEGTKSSGAADADDDDDALPPRSLLGKM